MKTLSNIICATLITISLNSFAADCPSLSGQYTIGKNEQADFTNIMDAVNALQCGGVAGPVTFQIEDGVYNERVVLSSVKGASAFNTIMFESKSGNTSDVMITYKTSDATMLLNGVSHVSFKELTVDHATSVYGNAMRIDGKSSDIHFKAVAFEGVEVARTGANSATVYFISLAPKSDISFEDCEINNGSIGICKSGVSAENADSKTVISGTLFFNQFETALALANEDAPVLINNVVSSLSNYSAFYGIKLDHVSNDMIVSNNIITTAHGAMGVAMKDCMGKEAKYGQITNNSITVGGSDEAYGIYLSGTTDNQMLNYNRIKLSLQEIQAKNQAYYKNAGSGNNVNMMNNMMYDLNAGGYTIIGNSYKDFFNQLPAQNDLSLSVSANGITIEKVSSVK